MENQEKLHILLNLYSEVPNKSPSSLPPSKRDPFFPPLFNNFLGFSEENNNFVTRFEDFKVSVNSVIVKSDK